MGAELSRILLSCFNSQCADEVVAITPAEPAPPNPILAGLQEAEDPRSDSDLDDDVVIIIDEDDSDIIIDEDDSDIIIV